MRCSPIWKTCPDWGARYGRANRSTARTTTTTRLRREQLTRACSMSVVVRLAPELLGQQHLGPLRYQLRYGLWKALVGNDKAASRRGHIGWNFVPRECVCSRAQIDPGAPRPPHDRRAWNFDSIERSTGRQERKDAHPGQEVCSRRRRRNKSLGLGFLGPFPSRARRTGPDGAWSLRRTARSRSGAALWTLQAGA